MAEGVSTTGRTGLAARMRTATGTPLATALGAFRSALVGVGLFSAVSNLLMLTGAFFMLQIYDRVLPSRSVPTLVALSMLALALFAFQAVLDILRARILSRIATTLDDDLAARIFGAVLRLPLKGASRADAQQPLRDLDAIRGFLSGAGPSAIFDLPWLPVYLAIIYLFHPLLGAVAFGGAVVLVCLTVMTEMLTRGPISVGGQLAGTRTALAEAGIRNAETLASMGMAGPLAQRWRAANTDFVATHQSIGDVAGGLGGVSKSLRMILQSGVLAVGAWLVIMEQASAGIIIAGSILVARALAPVDLAIANWKNFVAARQGWTRINRLLELLAREPTPMPLPAPRESVSLHGVSLMAPGTDKIVLKDMSFALQAGQALGVIGPSAAGKSSLLRVLIGAWQPGMGKVAVDGAALGQWDPAALGRHVGYLPQEIELFTGTIAENIARFDAAALPEAIIAAARGAGVHEMIVALPGGYDTPVGDRGQALSSGQRQRVALARALYGEPFLVVLDEPNSNLDGEGDAALTQAIIGVRRRGGIVVVAAQRTSALAGVDLVLAMERGQILGMGPRDEVLAKLRQAGAPTPLKVVGDNSETQR